MVLAEAQTGRNPDFERRALQHLRKTNSPETLGGLSWDAPLRNRDYVIVKDFWLVPEKRPDRQMAPCPACSPNAPKYYQGSLAWFPAEGVYRCIGRDCASHHVGMVQARMARQEYKAEQQHATDMQFVYDNLGFIPRMVACVTKLQAAAVEIEALGRQFGRVPVVRKELYDRTKGHDSQLVVYEQKEVERFDLRAGAERTVVERVPVYLGMLRGTAMLRGKLGLSQQINILSQALSAMDHGEHDRAQEWFLGYNPDRNELAQARMMLRSGAKTYSRVRARIRDAFAFFTVENFELIRNFSVHPLNPNHFFAACTNGTFRIRFAGKEMNARPNWAVLTDIPDCPEFNEPNI